jgi:hypothetical protein
MRYADEVPVAEDDLNGQMSRMRGWLDHQRFEPSSFRLSRAGNRQVVRVLFKTENEALAFAAKFQGLLLASSVPEAAIA